MGDSCARATTQKKRYASGKMISDFIVNEKMEEKMSQRKKRKINESVK